MSGGYLTPAAIAESLGVDADCVRGWIASGELPACNVCRVAGSRRPRWRVDPADLEQFLLRRRHRVPPRQERQAKRSADRVIQFF